MNCSECNTLKIAFANATIGAVSAEARLIGCPLEQWQEWKTTHEQTEEKKRRALHELLKHQQSHH